MSDTWKLIKECLDKNPDMKFVIRRSTDDPNMPPHGKYEMWLTKLVEKDTTRFCVHGDNMFDAIDINVGSLLDAAKFDLNKE